MNEVQSRDLRPDQKRLDSWKEIAAYLNHGVRTVQRWEQIAGLPIHRVPHEKKGRVCAFSGELDAWWKAGGDRLANEPELSPPNSHPRRRWYWAAGGVALIAAVLSTWWAIGRPVHPIAPSPRLVPLTAYPGVETFPAFSPDGSRIAFVWQRDGETSGGVYTQVVGAGGSPLQLAPIGTRPAWSPDGRFVSYFRATPAGADWDLAVTTALGGAERVIARIPAVRYLPGPFQAWTHDGKWIVVPERAPQAGPYALTAISVASGDRHRLTHPPPQTYGDGAPIVSKDGRTLAFVRSASLSVHDVFIQRLDLEAKQPPEPRRLTRVGWLMRSLFWDGSGHDILFTADSGEARRVWRVSAARAEQPQLVTSVNLVGDHAAISPQGDRLVYADVRRNLSLWRQTVPRPGVVPLSAVRLISSTRIDANPRVSPDGKRIAFASDRTGSTEIWLADSDGGRPVQLTALGAYTGTPRWAPDGSRIAFDTRVNGNADIYVVNADGGGIRQLTRETSDDYVPSWSRDGKSIYFISNRSGLNQLWKMPADGGPAIQITNGGAADGIESADGNFVYFARSFGVTSVWRVPSSGGTEEKVFDGLQFPLSFEVGPTGIYYFRAPTAEDPARALLFYSFARRRTERIAAIQKTNDNGLGMSPDGRWFVYAAAGRFTGDLMMIENFR